MARIPEMILGILGGVLGAILSLVVLVTGGLFQALFGIDLIVYLAITVLILSAAGIICSLLVNFFPRVMGVILILLGIAIFVCLPLISLPITALFIAAGIMALVRE